MTFRWHEFAMLAYWSIFKPPAQFSRPRRKKPPDPRKNKHLLMLALTVALWKAKSMPDISLSSGKTLRKSLRKYKRHGMLMTCKLPEATRLQVLDALQALPNQLIQKGDVIPLIMDTGASRTVTGMKDDFLPGTLHDLATPLVLGGVGGKLVAEQAGTVRYEMLDDAGELVVVECEAIYSPTLCCRLFSPQTFHREFYARGAGESEFATRHNRALFRIPKVDGKGTHTITVPYDKSTHLPIIEGFKNATAVAESLAMSCVTDALNQNLTSLQKVMLQWHYKIGHIGFQHLQWIGRQGWLGKMGARMGSTTVIPPKCASCQYGKQHRKPTAGSTTTKHNEGVLKKDKLDPGDLVFSDQYESYLPGRVFNARGASVSSQKIRGGTLFADAATGFISVHHQVSLTAVETITSKLKFEREAYSAGVSVKDYRTDNGIYTSREFARELETKGQGITHSGVGGHHHNAVAENNIGHIVRSARTMMIHAALRWPAGMDKDLWPLAMSHAVHIYNHTPKQDSGLSPMELWTRTKSSHSVILNARPWGCVGYVLDPRLQDGMKLPKWTPRSRKCQYVGASPLHASTVGLVRNLQTGNISPQFHVVYDDYFETVHATDTEPAVWKELVSFQTFRSEYDNEDYVPELGDEWLSTEEKIARREREHAQRSATSPLRENIPQAADREPSLDANVDTTPPTPRVAPRVAADLDAPNPDVPEQPAAVAPREQPSGSPRRSTRAKRQPVRLGFEKQHQYAAVAKWSGRMIKAYLASSFAQHDYNYIYALLMDTEYGLMENLMPNVMAASPCLLKASATDPDLPTVRQALAGPHKEEFLTAMRSEIRELEEHKTWTVVQRNDLPTGANVLPSTWVLRIKRFPDGRLRKFKARFCARGDRQIEGVDYFDKWAPVVSWSTVRMLLCMSINQGWDTRQVDFSNAFVQATLKEDVYISLPDHFETDEGYQRGEVLLKLDKSLYGLVQSPLMWYSHLTKAFEAKGFTKSDHDPCMMFGRGMIVLIYVDDCLFFGPDGAKIDAFVNELEKGKGGMPGMALTREDDDVYHFLGVSVDSNQKSGKVLLTQRGLIDKVLRTVGLDASSRKKTPASSTPLGTDADGDPFTESWQYSSVVGMLLYVSSNSRPDIQFAVHQCARFTHCPKKSHGEAVKRICRYLQGTREKGLIFNLKAEMRLDCYVDADFAGLWRYESDQDPVCVKSRTGYVITLAGCPCLWASRLQVEIALSTLEAEYIALSTAMRDLLPMRRMLLEIGTKMKLAFLEQGMLHSTVFEDNNGALGLATSPKLTPRTRHIASKYHFFKSHCGDARSGKAVIIQKISTDLQKADIFTKGLTQIQFEHIRYLLMGW